MRWEVILVGASWAKLSGDTLSHPPPTLVWGSPGSTWQPSCLYQGIQPWLGAASIEGRENSWANLSDVVEFLVNYPWSCPPSGPVSPLVDLFLSQFVLGGLLLAGGWLQAHVLVLPLFLLQNISYDGNWNLECIQAQCSEALKPLFLHLISSCKSPVPWDDKYMTKYGRQWGMGGERFPGNQGGGEHGLKSQKY